MSSENQTNIRFSLKETVWFQKGQEVKEVRSLSLNPDITIQQFDEYVQVKGVLTLEGNYAPDQSEQGDYFSLRELAPSRLVEDVRGLEDGSYELRHQFPVDISIPLTRITDLENLCVSVETFDYQLTERGCIQIAADLCISGLHDNRAVDNYHEQRAQEQYNSYTYSNDYRSSNEAEEQPEDRELDEQFQFFNQQPSVEVNDKEDLYGSDWIQSLEDDEQQEEDPAYPRQPTYLEVFQAQPTETVENREDHDFYQAEQQEETFEAQNIEYSADQQEETFEAQNIEYSAEQQEETFEAQNVEYSREQQEETFEAQNVEYSVEQQEETFEAQNVVYSAEQQEETFEAQNFVYSEVQSEEPTAEYEEVYREAEESNEYVELQNEVTTNYKFQPSFLNNEVNARQSFLNNEFTAQQQPNFLNNESTTQQQPNILNNESRAQQQPSFLNNVANEKPSFLNNDYTSQQINYYQENNVQQNNSYRENNTHQNNPYNVQNDIQNYEEQFNRSVEQSYQPYVNNQYQHAPFSYNQQPNYQNPFPQVNQANPYANDVRQTPPYYAEYYQAQVEQEAAQEAPNVATNIQEEEANEPRSNVKSDNLLSSLFTGEGREDSYSKLKLYLAQNGDTIETVAKKYNLQTQQLNRVNNLNDEFLSEGQIIYIPVTAIKQ